MSLSGRRIIDGIKSRVGGYLRLPAPPYGTPAYWTSVYRHFKATDTFEWGNLTLGGDLLHYEYTDATAKTTSSAATTFAETIDIDPSEVNTDSNGERSVMILGCGYSRLGEDMAEHGWNHLVQVDIASKVISDLSERCSNTTTAATANMKCIEDDATTLSAFSNQTMDAVVDKGLLDSLFLSDEYPQMADIMTSVHRILKPNGTFCIFSLSEPSFVLPKLLPAEEIMLDVDAAAPKWRDNAPRKDMLWKPIEVRKLETAFLYRCQKLVPVVEKNKSFKKKYKKNRR